MLSDGNNLTLKLELLTGAKCWYYKRFHADVSDEVYITLD
jgi:hypothetical protein